MAFMDFPCATQHPPRTAVTEGLYPPNSFKNVILLTTQVLGSSGSLKFPEVRRCFQQHALAFLNLLLQVIPSMATPPEPAGGPAAKSAGDKSTEAVEGAAGNAAVAATSAAEGAAASTGEVAATAASTGTAAVDAATSAAESAAASTGEVAATAASTGTAAVDAATSAAEGAAASTGEVAATAASTGTAVVDAATSASTDAAGTIRAKAQAASPSATATKALLFPAGSACARTGMLLQDSLLPAPVEWTETAEKCQQTCQTSKTCTLFSWKADSNPAGGCWLFPERSSPLGQISDPKASSGPKECPSSEDLEQGSGKAFISQSPSGFGSNTLWLILAGAATAAALGGMAVFASTGSKRKSKRGLTVAAGDEEMATPIAPSPMFAPPSARAGPTPTYQTPGFQPVVYQRLPLPQQTYQIHQVPQAWLRKSGRYHINPVGKVLKMI